MHSKKITKERKYEKLVEKISKRLNVAIITEKISKEFRKNFEIMSKKR